MYQKRYTQNRTNKTDGFTNKKRHMSQKAPWDLHSKILRRHGKICLVKL